LKNTEDFNNTVFVNVNRDLMNTHPDVPPHECGSEGKRPRRYLTIQGINVLSGDYLPRRPLVSKLKIAIYQDDVVLISSPASSGKSSLLKMIQIEFPDWLIIEISCIKKRDLTQFLQGIIADDAGVMYTLKDIQENVMILMDDAQHLYNHVNFWQSLLKGPSKAFEKVKIVIAATHKLYGGYESPAEFGNLRGLNREDFLLSDAESRSLLTSESRGIYKRLQDESLIRSIISQAGGLIGALIVTINSFNERFSAEQPSEREKNEYLLSGSFIKQLMRCFSTYLPRNCEMDKSVLEVLQRSVLVDGLQFPNHNYDSTALKRLQKCGIILFDDTHCRYSSIMAKHYYFKFLFPKRISTNPESIHALMLNVIRNISGSILKNSSWNGLSMPKEGALQHIIFQGLCKFTRPEVSVIPELSKCLGSGKPIEGEIDFMINSSIRWGLEILMNGQDITGHLGRFEKDKKYFPLQFRDYSIIDIRLGKPDLKLHGNLFRHEKKITVFVKPDFTRCTCVFGMNDQITIIRLAP
jgi:hypothetical protein